MNGKHCLWSDGARFYASQKGYTKQVVNEQKRSPDCFVLRDVTKALYHQPLKPEASAVNKEKLSSIYTWQ